MAELTMITSRPGLRVFTSETLGPDEDLTDMEHQVLAMAYRESDADPDAGVDKEGPIRAGTWYLTKAIMFTEVPVWRHESEITDFRTSANPIA